MCAFLRKAIKTTLLFKISRKGGGGGILIGYRIMLTTLLHPFHSMISSNAKIRATDKSVKWLLNAFLFLIYFPPSMLNNRNNNKRGVVET